MTTTTGADVLEHGIGESGSLRVRLPAGDVELHAVDGPLASVRDLDGRPIEERFVVDRGDRRLELRMRDRVSIGRGFLRGDHGRARLRIDVPRTAAVSIETASGTIAATGLEREQRYRSASGSITVNGSGTLTLDTVSGNVRVEAGGDVDLAVRVVSGGLDVHGGRLRSAVISTTSGDVALDSELSGPGPYGIQSVSGDARIRADRNLTVEARTLTGEIESSVAAALGSRSRKGRRNLVIGDGRNVLTFKSVSGDLRVLDAGLASGAPASHGAPEPPAPPTPLAPPASAPDPGHDERLAILRDLEEGRIDVAEAGERLAAMDGSIDG